MNLVNAPVILGHECSGVISAIGTDVNDYHVGVCPFDPDTKVSIGSGIDGVYATKMKIPTIELIKLSENVSFVQGVAATDAGITSHHAIFEVEQAQKGMKVEIYWFRRV